MCATSTQSIEDTKYFSATIGSYCSRNTIVRCTIFSCGRVAYFSRSLQKQCFLALDVPLNPTHEGPHRWVVTLEQWLQPVVPPLDAVGAASYTVGPCSVLIPGCDGECGWTVSRCTSSSSAAADVSVFEERSQLVQMSDSCWLRLSKKFECLLHVVWRTKKAREDSGRSCEFRRWFRTPSSVLSRSLCELRSDRGGGRVWIRWSVARWSVAAPWHKYTATCLSNFRSCYNKCIKSFFFGYSRRYSLTQALLETGLPSFDTIIHNSACTFTRSWHNVPMH